MPSRQQKKRPVENEAPGVMQRQSVKQSLPTGLKVVDALVPIGKGQRELIIGDRKTGKNKYRGRYDFEPKRQRYIMYLCRYWSKKESTVKALVETLNATEQWNIQRLYQRVLLNQHQCFYIAPYAGTAMGEEWMYQGRDVLIVYDDLSKQAAAYREISLLLRRPPGREAYPGDVFYLHSRLLERAAKLSDELGAGSLTALPIIETQAGDISAYIPTNVISITDGQIFLESDLFYSGYVLVYLPDYLYRVLGGSAQIKAMKKVSGTLRIDLASYRELKPSHNSVLT